MQRWGQYHMNNRRRKMDETIHKTGGGVILHHNGFELVEWICDDCGHVWYESADAIQYPNYCPECGCPARE